MRTWYEHIECHMVCHHSSLPVSLWRNAIDAKAPVLSTTTSSAVQTSQWQTSTELGEGGWIGARWGRSQWHRHPLNPESLSQAWHTPFGLLIYASKRASVDLRSPQRDQAAVREVSNILGTYLSQPVWSPVGVWDTMAATLAALICVGWDWDETYPRPHSEFEMGKSRVIQWILYWWMHILCLPEYTDMAAIFLAT